MKLKTNLKDEKLALSDKLKDASSILTKEKKKAELDSKINASKIEKNDL